MGILGGCCVFLTGELNDRVIFDVMMTLFDPNEDTMKVLP